MDAYCEMANLMLNNGFSDLMETKMHHRTVEFSFVKPWHSPSARDAWDGYVAGAQKHQRDPYYSIKGFIGLDVEGGGYVFPDGYPRAIHQTVSPALTWIDDDGRLGMRFTVKADLLMRREKDGQLVTLPLSRRVDFGLVRGPGGDKPWLIDGWTSKWKFGQYTPMGG